MDERERQYREYLALRQGNNSDDGFSDDSNGYYRAEDVNKTRPDHSSITNTPYGASELRRKQKEKEQRDRAMREYLAARETDRKRRGVRSGVRQPDRQQRPDRAVSGRDDGYDYGYYDRGQSRNSGKKSKGSAYAENTSYRAVREQKRPKVKIKAKDKKSGGRKGDNGGKGGNGRKGGKKGLRRWVTGLSAVVIGVAALVVVGLVMALAAFGSMEHIDIDENAIAINPSVEAQLDGYRNIAVLGIDARADEDDSQCRSDAIIVASINEETDEVKMFSVYRDTLLDVGDQGLDKVTHAYFYGGAQQTLYTLNKNMDLNIDEAVVINWKTVADIIDSVGGIEIDIQESEIDEMNKYIPNTAKNVDGPDDLIEAPGKQTLNGVQAVTYSRIRKDAATGDYRRNERMKTVFSETFKKVKQSGFFTMFRVAKNAMPEIKTNMSAGDVLGIALKFKSYDMTDSTTGFPYDVASWTGYAGAGYAWYGPPVNLYNNVSKLHAQFFDQEGYAPTDTVQEISNNISYTTGIY